MDITKVGAQIVATDPNDYPPDEYDFSSIHAREKVTTTHVVISDLANPNMKYTCLLAEFTGAGVPIVTQAAIKAFLRPIIGS
jgi:hypothetical protein